MRRILVTAIGGDVGHSILKCLYKTNDKLYGCDVVDYPVGGDLVEKYHKIELANHSNYINSILDICKLNSITHIIPVSEPEIIEISKNREVFIGNGIKLLINSEVVLSTCLDKYKTCVFLKRHNLNAMNFSLYDEFVEDGQKHIVKLRRSCGSKLLKVFKYKSELNDTIEKYDKDDLIIQDYIDADDSEFTVGVFKYSEDIRVIIFNRELQNGFTKFIELSHDQQIYELAVEVARLMDVEGSINIQLRKKDDNIYIFEINPRLSGTTNFRNKLGFQDVIWWLNAIDNEPIDSYDEKYESAIGIREMNEKIIMTSLKNN